MTYSEVARVILANSEGRPMRIYFLDIYHYGGFRFERVLSVKNAIVHADSLNLDNFGLFF